MGNQPSGTGSMSGSRHQSGQGSSYGGQQQQAAKPPGGAAPVGYMSAHAQQYGVSSDGGGGSTVKRSASDTSMTDMMAVGPGGSTGGGGNIPLDLASISAAEEDTVPTVFRWEHGGRNVYITGTFNGWSRQIPMHRSGNDFTYIHNLKRGKHAFKFIVDDEWRFAPDQPTVADIEGRINNFIDVTDFKAYTGDKEFENERHADHCSVFHAQQSYAGDDSTGGDSTGDKKGSAQGRADPDGEIYGHSMPDLDEYTKEPPPLPPHLRHIILNKPPQLQDTAALPVPQHVALNHLYCTAIKDNMMVLGITQRYKTKSCTTVYYSPC
jgi:5'-AMP-activated protein kinase regulatory beta subunit